MDSNKIKLFSEEKQIFDKIIDIWKKDWHRKLICLTSLSGYGKTTIALQLKEMKHVLYYDFSQSLDKLNLNDNFRNEDMIKYIFNEITSEIQRNDFKKYLIILDHINQAFFPDANNSKFKTKIFRKSNFLNNNGTILLIYDTNTNFEFEFSCIIKYQLKKPSLQSFQKYIEEFYPEYNNEIKDLEEINNYTHLNDRINFLKEKKLEVL